MLVFEESVVCGEENGEGKRLNIDQEGKKKLSKGSCLPPVHRITPECSRTAHIGNNGAAQFFLAAEVLPHICKYIWQVLETAKIQCSAGVTVSL